MTGYPDPGTPTLLQRLAYWSPVLWATSWIGVGNVRLYRAYDNFVINYWYDWFPPRRNW